MSSPLCYLCKQVKRFNKDEFYIARYYLNSIINSDGYPVGQKTNYIELYEGFTKRMRKGCECGMKIKPTKDNETEFSKYLAEELCDDWCGCCTKCKLEFDRRFLPIAQHYKHDVGDVLISK